MTNDEAREAAQRKYARLAGRKTLADSYNQGWNDAIAHLRATGQLCTAEDRHALDILDDASAVDDICEELKGTP